jgi:hypothetical protein
MNNSNNRQAFIEIEKGPVSGTEGQQSWKEKLLHLVELALKSDPGQSFELVCVLARKRDDIQD